MGRRSTGAPDRRALLILAVAMIAAAALLLWLGRGTGYIYDEWYFWADYRPLDLGALLQPDNGNLVAIPIAIYKAVIKLWDIAYLPLRVIGIAALLGAVTLFFLLASAGDRKRGWLALGPALLLLFFGTAWDVIAIPLGMVPLLGLCFGLAALLAIQRSTFRADLAALALLCAGIATFTVVVAFAVAVAVVILVDGGPRRWRRLLVPAVPLIAYAAYRWHYRDYPTIDGAELTASHVLDAPLSLLDSWRALFESFAGSAELHLSRGAGLALLVLVAVAVVYRLRMPQPVDRRALALAAALVTFWLSIAVVGKDPLAARYQFPAMMLLLALVVELVAGLRFPRPALIAAALALGVSIAFNTVELVRNTRDIAFVNAELNRAKLAAVEIIRDRLPADFGLAQLANPEAPRFADIYVITAGQYYAAASLDGSPAMSEAELRTASERQRAAADRLLFNGLALPALVRPAPLRVCRPAQRQRGPWTIESGPLRHGGFGVRAGGAAVTAQMRRFADVSTTYPLEFALRSSRWSAIPNDRSQVPWKALLVSPRPFELCLRRGPGA
jgi:hypothetical protein